MTKRRYNLTQSLGLNQFFKGKKTEIPVTKEEANFYKNKLYLQNQAALEKRNRGLFVSPRGSNVDKSIPVFEKDSCIVNLAKELNISKETSPIPRPKKPEILLSEERSSNKNNESPYNLEMSRLGPLTPTKPFGQPDNLSQFAIKNLKNLFTGKPFNIKIDQYLTRKSLAKISLDQIHSQLPIPRTERGSFKGNKRIQLNGLVTTRRGNKERKSESDSPKKVIKHIKSSSIGSHTDQQLIPPGTSHIQQSSPVQGWSIQKVENYS